MLGKTATQWFTWHAFEKHIIIINCSDEEPLGEFSLKFNVCRWLFHFLLFETKTFPAILYHLKIEL